MARGKQVAYLFDEAGANSVTARGGKGFGLSELVDLGVPVPPGFTVTTSVARAFAQHGRLPKRLEQQLERQLKVLESRTGKKFGRGSDSIDPLLLSVRSGAAVSMPGMMDTILNLGMNDEVVSTLANKYGHRFSDDCFQRFQSMFNSVVAGGAGNPDDPWLQLEMALIAVLNSWNSRRALTFRKEHGISNGLGTAVNVQSMVFGNLDDRSGTGVAFSRNVATGADQIYGEFLINAQGEDIVAGTATPLPLSELEVWNADVFNQLSGIVRKLEEKRNDVVEVEFTVESGQLYVLQVRNAMRTPEAAATIATHFVWEKRWSKHEALSRVSADQLDALSETTIPQDVLERMDARGRILARGMPASPGVAFGTIAFTSEEAVMLAKTGEPVVLYRPDTSPDDLEGMLAADAIVTQTGGTTSHAAVVARALGKPAVVGCVNLDVEMDSVVTVDGRSGAIVSGELAQFGSIDKKEVNLFKRWAKFADASFKLPKLHFSMVSEKVSVNHLVNDFYLADAMAKASVGTELERRAADLKARVHRIVAERLAMYLVVAVASEAQYIFDINRSSLQRECHYEVETLKSVYNADAFSFSATDSMGAIARLKHLPHDQHVSFLRLVKTVFEVWGHVGYGGYGGEKWAAIAGAAENFLCGKINSTVFADHAFDLQHNTGSVFGKHKMLSWKHLLLEDQLDLKKQECDVSRLYSKLRALCPRYSDEVRSLYQRGVSLAIW